ncbi:MAG: DUF362 domain-containing protein [Bacteroidales bacterium]|nr:DUF362 domain-containing protein [Bacteroidales bacterium]
MKLNRLFATAALSCSIFAMAAQSDVYVTKDITPESLVKIYKALGKEANGRVAVKISTGEPGGHNFLQPALIGELVDTVNGTIVECNTAYTGKRYSTEDHIKAAYDHGFFNIAAVDILDAAGEIKIPVRDSLHIKYDIVGSHIKDYDFLITLSHFKGHAMGGFGGALKNQSIGVASGNGKTYIHSAGKTSDKESIWRNIAEQDQFLESMAAAAQAVDDYFHGNVIYINVMNNMSIDCDCNGHPANPEIKDFGILASTDPVALDQACVDIIYSIKPEEGNDPRALIERIEEKHGIHTIEHAEKIGLGSRKYNLISIDK